jgi:glucose-6-phosphate 1-dehydrogenase
MKTQLVIFGITGDLATRKLLPALDEIVKNGASHDLSIIGISRREGDISEQIAPFPALEGRASLYTMDLAEAEAYKQLRQYLEVTGADQTLFYLAVPPGAATSIVDFLGEAGLNSDRYKVLFEKPFGFDLASAQDFITRTSRYFHDDQLYRIDHYMAKEIAAEILRIRREATDADLQKKIRAVTIVASEKIGIEGRVQFYEQTGALRDFIQGHLLQLLSLVLIRKPSDAPLPEQRLAAFSKLLPVSPQDAIRAQYEGYRDEVATPKSTVETFVSLRIKSTDPEWEDVTMKLITGKALAEKRSYIEFTYIDGSTRILDEAEVLRTKGDRTLDAYERVLVEAVNGNKDMFTSGEEVLRTWELLAPLQQDWEMENAPLLTYTQGAAIEDITQ